MQQHDSEIQEYNQPKNHENVNAHDLLRTMTIRFFVILILFLLCLLPLSIIDNFVGDKVLKKQSTIEQLENRWGNPQTLIGPILSIPYVERISRIESQTDASGVKRSVSKDIFNNKTLRLLPENLNIKALVKAKNLKNNTINTEAYQANVDISGNFNIESLPEASGYNTIEWDKAYLSLGFTENSSVEASMPLRWEGSSTILKPGTNLISHLPKGFHANLEEVASENSKPQFKLQLSLKGNQHLTMAPIGELTSINVSTDTNHAQVIAKHTPSSKVSSDEGLQATWRVSNLVRNYPQQWLIEDTDNEPTYDFSEVLVGIKWAPKDDSLSKVQLSLRYLGVILGIVFLSLFVLEFRVRRENKRLSRVNLVNYLVVALAIWIFPILLLTFADIFNQLQSFQLAAGSCIILVACYCFALMKSFTRGLFMLLIVASLFGALFVILEKPEQTLLAISCVGIFITVLLMLASWNSAE